MSYRPINSDPVDQRIQEYSTDARSVDWWGVVMLLVVLLAFFASIMFSWFFLQFGAEAWPPEGVESPDLLLPTIATVALLVSTLPLLWLQIQLRRERPPRFNLALGSSAALGVVYLAVQAVHFTGLDFSATGHAYGSTFYLITIFHAVLVFAGLYVGAIVQARAWQGHFTPTRHVAIDGLAAYWYTLALMWLFIYPSLYLPVLWE